MSSKKNKIRNIFAKPQQFDHFNIKVKDLSNEGPWFPFIKGDWLEPIWEAFKDCNLDFASAASLKWGCWEGTFNGWVSITHPPVVASLWMRTLSSIVTLKMAGLEPNCLTWEPTTHMISESQNTTNTCNKQQKPPSSIHSLRLKTQKFNQDVQLCLTVRA